MSATNATHDAQRPYSIDLSLELEHQLAQEENDSLPPMSPTRARPPSLDSTVLASIIAQLRESLAQITKERDDLLSMVAKHASTESDLKDTLAHLTDKLTTTQEEMQAAREKARDDHENITMLRAKVEESRRGLMKLQTESRRSSVMSTMTLDLARAGSFTAPSSSRRPTFTPLTGSAASRAQGHRRGQSVSEDGFVVPELPRSLGTPLPPNTERSRSPDRRSITSSPPRNSKRLSGFFGRTSPAATPYATEPSAPHAHDGAAELERMQKELASAREQLEETRHELTEANEAKEASETCVKVLREFIAENGVGERALPAAAQSSATATAPPPASKQGWGFKLWRADSTTSTASASSATPPAPAPVRVSMEASSQPPRTQKIGGFFGARTSVASEDGVSGRGVHGEDSSDVSSADDSLEPISPASDLPRGVVLFRNASSASTGEPSSAPYVGKESEAPAPAGVALAI